MEDVGDKDKERVRLKLAVHIALPCSSMKLVKSEVLDTEGKEKEMLVATNLCRFFQWDWRQLVQDKKKVTPTRTTPLTLVYTHTHTHTHSLTHTHSHTKSHGR